MEIHPLISISPIDGRYHVKTKELNNFFSEFALFKYRTQIEVEYFIALCEIPLPNLTDFPKEMITTLRNWYKSFSLQDAIKIKEIESVTNHDVKAVEYFIKKKFDELNLSNYKEFIHFGLTSQDINNTSVPVSVKNALNHVILPEIEILIQTLTKLATNWKNIPMLARTHG